MIFTNPFKRIICELKPIIVSLIVWFDNKNARFWYNVIRIFKTIYVRYISYTPIYYGYINKWFVNLLVLWFGLERYASSEVVQKREPMFFMNFIRDLYKAHHLEFGRYSNFGHSFASTDIYTMFFDVGIVHDGDDFIFFFSEPTSISRKFFNRAERAILIRYLGEPIAVGDHSLVIKASKDLEMNQLRRLVEILTNSHRYNFYDYVKTYETTRVT